MPCERVASYWWSEPTGDDRLVRALVTAERIQHEKAGEEDRGRGAGKTGLLVQRIRFGVAVAPVSVSHVTGCAVIARLACCSTRNSQWSMRSALSTTWGINRVYFETLRPTARDPARRPLFGGFGPRRDGRKITAPSVGGPRLPTCVITRVGPVTHNFLLQNQSHGWPAGACPRAGRWPDPWAGHDTMRVATTTASRRLKRLFRDKPEAGLWFSNWTRFSASHASSAATPGRVFPSSHSRKAPPAVET